MKTITRICVVLLTLYILSAFFNCEAIVTPIEPITDDNKENEARVIAVYNVPLDRELQAAIIDLGKTYRIDPAIIFAMIERESKYDVEAIGDSGKALGLMQIQPRFHGERMAKLNCFDLLDPYQNVAVGVDYLAELVEYYEGDIGKALVAYNAGQKGAYEGWFKYGIYNSDYSTEILSTSQIIAESVITESFTLPFIFF